jgi:hypothetical protein
MPDILTPPPTKKTAKGPASPVFVLLRTHLANLETRGKKLTP